MKKTLKFGMIKKMSLSDIIQASVAYGQKKIGISEERIRQNMPIIRQYISYWREYPDMFVEFLCGSNPENFQLYFISAAFYARRCGIEKFMLHSRVVILNHSCHSLY